MGFSYYFQFLVWTGLLCWYYLRDSEGLSLLREVNSLIFSGFSSITDVTASIANSCGIEVNSYLTSNETSWWSSGIMMFSRASFSCSEFLSFNSDRSVNGLNILVKNCAKLWLGDPQNDTIGRIWAPGLCVLIEA